MKTTAAPQVSTTSVEQTQVEQKSTENSVTVPDTEMDQVTAGTEQGETMVSVVGQTSAGGDSTAAPSAIVRARQEQFVASTEATLMEDPNIPPHGTFTGLTLTDPSIARVNTIAMVVDMKFEQTDEDGNVQQIERRWEVNEKALGPVNKNPICNMGRFPNVIPHTFFMMHPTDGLATVEQSYPPVSIAALKVTEVECESTSPNSFMIKGSIITPLESKATTTSDGYVHWKALADIPATSSEVLATTSFPKHLIPQIYPYHRHIVTSKLSFGCKQENYITTSDHAVYRLSDSLQAYLEEMWSSDPRMHMDADWRQLARHNFRTKDGISPRMDGALYHFFGMRTGLKKFKEAKKDG
jgi:hypothetical protein